MQGVTIRDGTEPGGSGGLEFDLREVLAALGKRAVAFRWRSRYLQYVSRDEQDISVLERLRAQDVVSGADFVNGIDQLLQVIDGEFEAFDKNRRWVVIRAADSSKWEVWSDDQSVLEAVQAKFRITGDASGSQAGSRPICAYNRVVANRFDRITQNPNVLAGRATIRGLRVSVAHVVNLVANGMTPTQIVADLPDLEEEDVRQALAYAAALAQDEVHTLRA